MAERSLFTPLRAEDGRLVADLPSDEQAMSNAELEAVIRQRFGSTEAKAAAIVLRQRQELLAAGLVPVYPDTARPFPGFEA